MSLAVKTSIEFNSILSGTNSYSREVLDCGHGDFRPKVDQPLKGILRDKGGVSEDITRHRVLHQRCYDKMVQATKQLTEYAREINAAHGGGLLNLRCNSEHQFQWRVNSQLAKLSNGALTRATFVHPFAVGSEDFAIIDQCFREYGGDLKYVYRAIDQVAQDIVLRIRVCKNILAVLDQYEAKIPENAALTPKAEKEAEKILNRIWERIDAKQSQADQK